ncbi:MAG TPA: beta-propeller domain-containing protein, partial [Verrucomicrobiae bacterium]|nr:beta-propeller domain-containing protein [Verrucomicrobiae bacterium]
MKTRKLIVLASLCLALWGLGGGVASAAVQEPAITSIQVDRQTVNVVADVPAGIKKVTLEGRSRLDGGAWTPVAVQRVKGDGGPVLFTLAMSADVEVLRIRGDQDEPLPANFYQGTNAFAGPPSSADVAFGATMAPGSATLDTLRAGSGASATTSRAVVESDIWKVDGNTVYFFNTYRGLQVIDISNANAPVVRGLYALPAAGEQMYLLPGGRVVLLAHNGCDWWSNNAESQVIVLDTAGAKPAVLGSLPVTGSILESRLVGTALYVASQMYREVPLPPIPGKPDSQPQTQWEWGTMITSFDLSDPANPVAKSTIWTGGYGAIVTATDRFFFVANSSPNNYYQSAVRVIDISAPDGTMSAVSSILTAGRVEDKYKMDLTDGVFTAISDYWDATLVVTNRNWLGGTVTKLQTFSLVDPVHPQKLGELTIARGESLFASRFDGDHVYVVTFFRTDPLWVVDLSDPARPVIHGELQVPGWSTYIEPLGDRLVALGVETNRVTVSLFDVSNLSKPALLSKVWLGENYSWSEANYDEKAFGVLPEAGLLLVPYQGNTSTNGYAQRIQLIDLGRDTLTARGFIDHETQPRRATLRGDHIFSISGRELLSVDAADRDHPVVKADLELSWGADRVFVQGDYFITLANEWTTQYNLNLRVASVAAPDQVLASLTLTNDSQLVAAGLRDGRFYLLRGTSTGIYWPAIADGSTNQPPPVTNNATLTVT